MSALIHFDDEKVAIKCFAGGAMDELGQSLVQALIDIVEYPVAPDQRRREATPVLAKYRFIRPGELPIIVIGRVFREWDTVEQVEVDFGDGPCHIDANPALRNFVFCTGQHANDLRAEWHYHITMTKAQVEGIARQGGRQKTRAPRRPWVRILDAAGQLHYAGMAHALPSTTIPSSSNRTCS